MNVALYEITTPIAVLMVTTYEHAWQVSHVVWLGL